MSAFLWALGIPGVLFVGFSAGQWLFRAIPSDRWWSFPLWIALGVPGFALIVVAISTCGFMSLKLFLS